MGIQSAEAEDMLHPVGVITMTELLNILLFSDDTFFCRRHGIANFDSPSFHTFLEMAKNFPLDHESVLHILQADGYDPIGAVAHGEQFLSHRGFLSGAGDFLYFQTIFDDFFMLGFPGQGAPLHAAFTSTSLGIRQGTEHPEAAWEFVRKNLLPRSQLTMHQVSGFSIRIDSFLREIDLHQGEGEHVLWLSSGEKISVPPLSDEDVTRLRYAIDDIGRPFVVDHSVLDMVLAEILPFFAGDRTAEDTARIIQARVSLYLAEIG